MRISDFGIQIGPEVKYDLFCACVRAVENWPKISWNGLELPKFYVI